MEASKDITTYKLIYSKLDDTQKRVKTFSQKKDFKWI